MADKILDMLKNPNAKIVYFVGPEHLAVGVRPNSRFPTTAQLLRDANVSLSTYYQQLPSMPDGLMMSTRSMAQPTAIKIARFDVHWLPVGAGIAFYAADKQNKRAEKVNKHVIILCIVSTSDRWKFEG